MAAKTWQLTEVSNGTFVEHLELSSRDVTDTPEGWSVIKKTMRGGLSDGVEIVEINNGKLSFGVLLTRGMSLTTATIGKQSFGWKSPVQGPVHPKYVPLNEPSGLGWLDGFDEMMVRCGLESNGAPEFDAETHNLQYPLHGRIGNKPAQKAAITIDADAGTISVSGVVVETRFHFFKLCLETTITTGFGDNAIVLNDTVKNLSASPAEAQMLYHANFGDPLLDAGSKVVAPIDELVPRNDHAASGIEAWDSYQAAQPGFEEQVYFLKCLGDNDGNTEVLLKNAHSTQGVSLSYNINALPCFSVWKNTTALEDGFVTGIEPGTNYPNPRTYEGEQGRVIKLEPGGSANLGLTMQFLVSDKQVAEVEKRVAELQSGSEPTIHSKPRKGWCAP
ncbi:MAG: DUF4432 domain-containing protein [Planctomycetaceae bacterium]|nr:DUF4432 domain-containing protein [Planctomycetaceae bacterium]|tara:strand:+ start:438 stop:1607 length:1170 start_codon:yes stop_codon:yes gene_type:complete